MKSMNIKVTIFLIFYFIVAFFLVLGFSFVRVMPPENLPFIGNIICKGVPQDILPLFLSRYTVNNAFLLFFMMYPSLEITGILIAYSWVFAKNHKTSSENSKTMFMYLRSVLVVAIVCLILSVVATEIVQPLLLSKQMSIQNASHDFQEFTEMAKKSAANKDYDLAEMYANQALSIDPTSKETLELLRQNEINSSHFESTTGVHSFTGEEPTGPEINIPVKELSRRASAAYSSGSFFDAHYYATLVQRAFTLEDKKTIASALAPEDFTAATQIAADAWKKLQASDSTLGGLSEAMYALKMQGYSAILTGDYVRAYYVFRELQNATGGDPDILRYLQIAQENLEKQFFFIDETFDLQPFESVRNVSFSVKKKNGGRYVVGIRGISSFAHSGGLVQYLRGLHIVSYSVSNSVDEEFYVPYAKLLSEDAAHFGSEYAAVVEKQWKKTVPFLILTSVDRNNKDVAIKPTYYHESPNVVAQQSVFVLPMPYEDFLLITQAAQGAAQMSLDSLAVFCAKASLYGFAWESFFQPLCSRLCSPFLFIVLALIAAIIAWKFRISENQMVHLWWFLLIPCFSGCIYFLMSICSYFHNVLICAVLGATGGLALPIVIALYLAFFAVLCLLFTSMRND